MAGHTCNGSKSKWLFSALMLVMTMSVSEVTAVDRSRGSQSVQGNPQEPAPFLGSNFVRMMLQGSVVVGNTLYIDGGEINVNVSGKLTGNVPMNDTISIDLSQSWTPANAPINVTTKSGGAPILNGENLWPAADNESFYSFGGSDSTSTHGHVKDVPPDLWQFQAGAWKRIESQSPASPSLTHVRPAGGSGAFGGGSGYILGGFQGNNFDSNYDRWPMPGLLSYNISSSSWANGSSASISPFGTIVNGGMHFVQNFGPGGILVAMGGEFTGSVSQPWVEKGQNLASFGNVSVYDISTNSWYWQTATGATGPHDIPPSGTQFCLAGVQSGQGTYEIFVYGGHNDNFFNIGNTSPSQSEQEAQNIFNGVYVLSLPGFVWFKANDTSAQPRTGHTCELVGNRQMINIGGVNPSLGEARGWANPDPWPQGLGVFDMVDLKWTNTYDATAASYTPASAVQSWYSQPSSNSSVQWSSPQTRALFYPSDAASITDFSAQTPSHLSGGAIAGIVIGSIAGVALMVGLWLLLRRRAQSARLKSKRVRSRAGEWEVTMTNPLEANAVQKQMQLFAMAPKTTMAELTMAELTGEPPPEKPLTAYSRAFTAELGTETQINKPLPKTPRAWKAEFTAESITRKLTALRPKTVVAELAAEMPPSELPSELYGTSKGEASELYGVSEGEPREFV